MVPVTKQSGIEQTHLTLCLVYVGDWVRGKKQGHGKLTLNPEDKPTVYIGQWKEDYIEGKGELTSSDGTSYKGKKIKFTQPRCLFNCR